VTTTLSRQKIEKNKVVSLLKIDTLLTDLEGN